MNTQTPKQKPYVTKVGRDWIVLDGNGNDAFSSTKKEIAFMYLNNNYPELCKTPRKSRLACEADQLALDIARNAARPHEVARLTRRLDEVNAMLDRGN